MDRFFSRPYHSNHSATISWPLQILAVVALIACPLSTSTSAFAELVADFDDSGAVESYAPWKLRGDNPAIVPGGPSGKGHCLKAVTAAPASYCSIRIEGPIVFEKNLVLSFDYRTEVETDFEGAYLGIIFHVDGRQWCFRSEEFCNEWRRAQIELGRLHEPPARVLRPGMEFSSIRIYARVKEKTAKRGETKAGMTLWLDNLRLAVAEPESRLSDTIRTSYSNPPMFTWSPVADPKHQKLQYSRDPQFDGPSTQTVATQWGFHTPQKPLESGTWYWRVWNENDLFAGYSPIAQNRILSSFTTWWPRQPPRSESIGCCTP